MAARIISSSKTTLRSAGARARGNHQAIDISPRWGEERRTSVALQVETSKLQGKEPSKETTTFRFLLTTVRATLVPDGDMLMPDFGKSLALCWGR